MLIRIFPSLVSLFIFFLLTLGAFMLSGCGGEVGEAWNDLTDAVEELDDIEDAIIGAVQDIKYHHDTPLDAIIEMSGNKYTVAWTRRGWSGGRPWCDIFLPPHHYILAGWDDLVAHEQKHCEDGSYHPKGEGYIFGLVLSQEAIVIQNQYN